MDTIIDREAELLNDYQIWSHLCRCLSPDESGDVVISCDDATFRGFWVYGYFVYTDVPYIIGGKTIDELNNAPKRYEIYNRIGLNNHCTGFLAPSRNEKSAKVLWENDVVKVFSGKKQLVMGKIFYNVSQMMWCVSELDKEYKNTGRYLKMDTSLTYEYVGRLYELIHGQKEDSLNAN